MVQPELAPVAHFAQVASRFRALMETVARRAYAGARRAAGIEKALARPWTQGMPGRRPRRARATLLQRR